MIVIMLGAPGTGKGTVGGLLSESLNIPHISSGEIFRGYIKEDDELGRELKKYVSKGKLVPDDLTIKILERRLQEPDAKNGYILDGFPRTINQAEKYDELLSKLGKDLGIVIYIDIDKELQNALNY